MKKRVVIGLSGGVDSSVAAYLLKKEGYDVLAVYMVNWHDKTGLLKADCPWDEDVTFAELVAKKLDIPFHVVDLSKSYKKRVIDYMFSEYDLGRTPNPDVLCNREIKFDEFIKALEPFNADFVATGHYCQKSEINLGGKVYFQLLAGADKGKDQSYFLCQLNQKQLSKTLFPIGHLQKSEVREIARELKLASAEKKDSQGICFVGKVDLPTFLQQQLVAKEGDVIEIPKDSEIYAVNRENDNISEISLPWHYNRSSGIPTGKHKGAHFYTIGQRKGLNIGGKVEPLFIIATDVQENIIYVGQGQDHPGLFRPALFLKENELHWVRPDREMGLGETREYLVRIRYRQALQKASLIRVEKGMYIKFEEAQRGIAPGQFAAWYANNELIGSGVISS
ncbi:MAG: tRNA 2-thiouridine(34) synthase MnmA [Bacteroidales bacterium]|nr:tRNA 2-thiouridine(34) synthase MnmA [Bacteroidales bacterium]MCF8392157.1 tRNA 2-thiouridine(34) synthase MnmA [Bacteroidales bacterium]